jgi:hypothetical protein
VRRNDPQKPSKTGPDSTNFAKFAWQAGARGQTDLECLSHPVIQQGPDLTGYDTRSRCFSSIDSDRRTSFEVTRSFSDFAGNSIS